jgi:hypothetical protein
MCTAGEKSPGSVTPGTMSGALRMLDAALDYLNGPLTGELPAGAQGPGHREAGRRPGAGAIAVRRVPGA